MNKMAPYLKGGRRAINIRSTLNSYKDGGLIDSAENVRQHGRMGDVHLVHVNDEEFERMRQAFGDPVENPHTGIPEWGFFSSIANIFKKVAPILGVASLFIPGLNVVGALGDYIGSTSLGATLGAAGSNALAGAALGALGGGTKGAVLGGIGGFAGTPGANGGDSPLATFGKSILPNASAGTQLALGRGLVGAGGQALTGGDPLQGALSGVVMGGLGDKIAGSDLVQNGLSNSPTLQQGALGAAKGLEMSGLLGTDPLKSAVIGGGLGAASSAINKWKADAPQAPTAESYDAPVPYGPTPDQANGVVPRGTLDQAALGAITNYDALMPQLTTFKTKDDAINAMKANPDQRPIYDALSNFSVCDLSDNFGACLAQNWDAFNSSISKNAPKMAEGGGVLDQFASGRSRIQDSDFAHEGAVHGPGDGQDDLVPINAANGEYVIPSDVVSAAGSGSSNAGAKAFDGMVKNIRTHARSTSPKKLPPKAKSPLEYMEH